MSDEGERFEGSLFPASFSVIYCPFDDCTLNEPFKEVDMLLEHLKDAHELTIHNVSAVMHVLEDYLERLKSRGLLMKSFRELGQNSSTDAEIRESILKGKLVLFEISGINVNYTKTI